MPVATHCILMPVATQCILMPVATHCTLMPVATHCILMPVATHCILMLIAAWYVPQAYVRGVIEQRLDVLIPISHQPRELVSQIIADASTKFPEFSSCVRKRIRTFLKSYRRSRKVRDLHSTPNGLGTSPSRSQVYPV